MFTLGVRHCGSRGSRSGCLRARLGPDTITAWATRLCLLSQRLPCLGGMTLGAQWYCAPKQHARLQAAERWGSSDSAT